MYDYSKDARQTFRYSEAEIPEEHIYVPDLTREAEQGGWVTTLQRVRKSALLEVPVELA